MNSMYIFFTACVVWMLVFGMSYGIVKIARVITDQYGVGIALMFTLASVMLSGLVSSVIMGILVGVI